MKLIVIVTTLFFSLPAMTQTCSNCLVWSGYIAQINKAKSESKKIEVTNQVIDKINQFSADENQAAQEIPLIVQLTLAVQGYDTYDIVAQLVYDRYFNKPELFDAHVPESLKKSFQAMMKQREANFLGDPKPNQ